MKYCIKSDKILSGGKLVNGYIEITDGIITKISENNESESEK